ncbi:helix-turn-helix domain-containing protein [Streptomyces sp. NPDC090499]|uniref:AlbA family DNA-binding domain-containing protein n=1 Tax=Streptomyces sp. NPDC090499 TaxID=3365965 RepID=UPI00380AB2A9
MISIYLSPSNPRWTPKTEADLQAAITGGLIEEKHYFDAKEMLATKGDNKELARDLSSFAIDGGTMIVGLAEDKQNGAFSLVPQPLQGLPEKVEQVAHSLPDPPLVILTDPIKSEADPAQGYLVIHIPASPMAPHMVDGRYFGRGDKTKRTLPDSEVVRLHERRRNTEQDALALLKQEIDDDPMHDVGKQSHLFLVAQPLAAPRDMLLALTSGPKWNMQLARFIEKVYTPEVNARVDGLEVYPKLIDAGNGYRRSGGAARASSNLGDGRIFTRNPGAYHDENAIELRVFENGGLRLFSSRLSERFDGDTEDHFLYDPAVVGNTRRFLALVRQAAADAGYMGNWALALGLTRLRGRSPYTSVPQNYRGTSVQRNRYDRDTYEQATETTWAELNETAGAVTRRLVGSFLRTLAAEEYFDTALSDD